LLLVAAVDRRRGEGEGEGGIGSEERARRERGIVE